MRPTTRPALRPLALLSFAGVYLGRFLAANARVSGQILRPRLRIEPAVVDYELRSRTDLEVASFIAFVGLTPGTLVIGSRGGRAAGGPVVITVHAMHSHHPDDAVAELRDLEDRMLAAWRTPQEDA